MHRAPVVEDLEGRGRARAVEDRDEPDLWAEGYWRWGWLFEAMPVVRAAAEGEGTRLPSPSAAARTTGIASNSQPQRQ
jgi:hypothetical protein